MNGFQVFPVFKVLSVSQAESLEAKNAHILLKEGMLLPNYSNYIKAANLHLNKCIKFRWKMYQSFQEFCSVDFEMLHHKS